MLSRLLNSLLKVMLGSSIADTLEVNGSAPLEPCRFDKGKKKFRIDLVITREA